MSLLIQVKLYATFLLKWQSYCSMGSARQSYNVHRETTLANFIVLCALPCLPSAQCLQQSAD